MLTFALRRIVPRLPLMDIEPSYDLVPYPGFPYAQSHPDRLAAVATLFGMQPAPVEACRVLELGCASGGNLIPMAAAFPHSHFVGYDLAPTPIETGCRMIAELGIENTRLEAADILDLGDDLGEFDYIIAHGVYSWVPPPVRDKVLFIMQRHLAPHGVGYVSYNALPGCDIRRMLRGMMLYRLRGIRGPEAQIEATHELLRMLLEVPDDPETPTPTLLKREVRQVLERNPNVLFHDELSDAWEPVLFSDFIAHAERHQLKYLAESNIFDMEPRNLSRQLREQLERKSGGRRVEREQYMDFLKCRKFRQTLLCHDDVAISEQPLRDRVRELFAASSAKAVSPQPDLTGPRLEEFRGEKGAAMQTAHPLAKTAIARLIEVWPGAIHFDALLAHCSQRIGRAADKDELAEIVLATHRVGLVELHAHAPACVSQPGERPATTPLARWQARHGNIIATLRHTMIDATGAVERHLITLLDGTRDRATLAAELSSAIDPPPPLAEVAAEVDKTLDHLARFGLLTA